MSNSDFSANLVLTRPIWFCRLNMEILWNMPGVYFKLEVLSRWDRFSLDIHWSTKAKLTVTHRRQPKDMVFFHGQDKWKRKYPYCSCSDFKSKRATRQRLGLFLGSVPQQGSREWGSGVTEQTARCESCLQHHWRIALVELRKQGFCVISLNGLSQLLLKS